MNYTKEGSLEEYKLCAGRGCQKPGVHCLKILFVKRDGWFCETCASSLIADNLAAPKDAPDGSSEATVTQTTHSRN